MWAVSIKDESISCNIAQCGLDLTEIYLLVSSVLGLFFLDIWFINGLGYVCATVTRKLRT